jgi:hypothetical protein
MTRHKQVICCRASASRLRSRDGARPGCRGTAGSLARPGVSPHPARGAPGPRPGPWLVMSRLPGSGYHVPVRTEQLPGPRRREAAAARGGGLRSPSPAVRSGGASAAGTRLRPPAGTVRDTGSSTLGGRHRANSAPIRLWKIALRPQAMAHRSTLMARLVRRALAWRRSVAAARWGVLASGCFSHGQLLCPGRCPAAGRRAARPACSCVPRVSRGGRGCDRPHLPSSRLRSPAR